MTRRRLFFYHAAGLSGFTGMTALAAPPLLAETLGFSVVYLAIMIMAYTIGWACGFVSIWPRLVGMVFMAWLCFGIFTGLGSPLLGVMALVLSVVTYWPRRLWTHGSTTVTKGGDHG